MLPACKKPSFAHAGCSLFLRISVMRSPQEPLIRLEGLHHGACIVGLESVCRKRANGRVRRGVLSGANAGAYQGSARRVACGKLFNLGGSRSCFLAFGPVLAGYRWWRDGSIPDAASAFPVRDRTQTRDSRMIALDCRRSANKEQGTPTISCHSIF
jgi:hypothetical protein